jgi:hypothetical protein
MRGRHLSRRPKLFGAVILAAASVRRLLVAAVVATLVGAAQAAVAEDALHPQDGPHVDLNFELRDGAFVADVSMNLVFLDHLLPPEREFSDRIALSELRATSAALEARMAEVCVVSIDGVVVPPRLEKLAKNDPDESLLPLFPLSGGRGLRKIRFDLVMPFVPPADRATPRTISIVWTAYPPDELSLFDPKPPLAIAAELSAQGVREQVLFRQSEPEHVWHATNGSIEARLLGVPTPAAATRPSLPLVPLVAFAFGVVATVRGLRTERPRRVLAAAGFWCCAGALAWWVVPGTLRVPLPRIAQGLVGGGEARLPNESDAQAIFEPLHQNLYRAFDFVEESSIYDALALSVEGPLLEQTFLTIHRSLVMQEEGGAVSRVQALRHVATEIGEVGFIEHAEVDGGPIERRASFAVRSRYQVDGRVVHWGHAHERTIEYLARYVVVAGTKGWRIASADVLEQRRIDGRDIPGSDLAPVSRDGTFEL